MKSKEKRKICVVTGSRAEYGLQYRLLKEIQKDPDLQLQLIVTGMHLSPQFGHTFKQIEQDGFPIHAKVHILRYSDNEQGVTKAVGIGCQIFAHVLEDLAPDIVVILGDRFEMLSVAIAAYLGKIPLAHIHGGEATEGVFDEGIRHSITKMASIHFPAAEEYRRRIIQMGEDPSYVFNVGAPGLDQLYKTKHLTLAELSQHLDFKFKSQFALITYHPVTLEKGNPKQEIMNLLNALKSFPFPVVFTKANADPYGSIINETIAAFCNKKPSQYHLYDNLGMVYYSCLKHCSLMIGNSSSGIIEAPSFALPVVNIGDRQKNRVKAKNIIDVACTIADIRRGIRKALSKEFRNNIKDVQNPYDFYKDGRTSYRIKEKLKALNINGNLLKKSFRDIGYAID